MVWSVICSFLITNPENETCIILQDLEFLKLNKNTFSLKDFFKENTSKTDLSTFRLCKPLGDRVHYCDA